MITTFLNFLWKRLGSKFIFDSIVRKKINHLLDLLEKHIYSDINETIDKKTKNIEKILLIAFGGTGDIAIFSSFTKYLKLLYPNSKIHYIVHNTDKNMYISSLDKNIDKTIPVNLPRFFNFKYIKSLKKKYSNYDLTLYMSFYPNLRYLMSYVKFIEMPYFLFKSKPAKLVTPKIYLDFKIKEKDIIFINLDMLTQNFDNSYLKPSEMSELILYITTKFRNYNFIINNYLNLVKIENQDNIRFFKGSYKELLKIATSSKIFISSRNGLCDVIASSVSNKPMLIIYPDCKYPGKNGSPFSYIFKMDDIGYPNKIKEFVFNRENKGLNTLKNIISIFIENNYEK